MTLHGRISLDVYRFMRSEYCLPSYSLNAVCADLLGKGEKKEDVSVSVITELQNGTPETRRQLAVYCLKVGSAEALPMTFKCMALYSGCLPASAHFGQIQWSCEIHRAVPRHYIAFQYAIEPRPVDKGPFAAVSASK